MTRLINPSPTAPWADSANGEHGTQRTLIGKPPNNHWMHSVYPVATFDLTRPSGPDFPLPSPEESITLKTSTTPIIISPSKSALVIIGKGLSQLSPLSKSCFKTKTKLYIEIIH
jgi:hypothetical protein